MTCINELRLHFYWAMCQDCAASIYGTHPPSPEYAHRVARLLFGTGAHESQMYTYTRQKGFTMTDTRGAFGLWQQESISVKDSIQRLESNKELRVHCAAWLFQNETAHDKWYQEFDLPTTMRLTAGWDRLSCLWARLAYMRDPEDVPASEVEQAGYWGKWYQTTNNPVKNAQWYDAYERAYAVVQEGAVVA